MPGHAETGHDRISCHIPSGDWRLAASLDYGGVPLTETSRASSCLACTKTRSRQLIEDEIQIAFGDLVNEKFGHIRFKKFLSQK
jgi:hypothetical protein